MAFDGITIANLVNELKGTLLDGRINKKEMEFLPIQIHKGFILQQVFFNRNELAQITDMDNNHSLTQEFLLMLVND